MPLVDSQITKAGELLIWELKENTTTLKQILENELQLLINNPEYRSEKRMKEWLACRLLQNNSSIKDQQITYTSQGKPILENGKFLSFSHSEHYCALLISENNCGVDIEENRPALEKVKHKFLSESELKQLPHNPLNRLTYLQWAWGIKESMLKITGEKNFDYLNQIQIKHIDLERNHAVASFVIKEVETSVNCHLIKSPHYYLVCVTE